MSFATADTPRLDFAGSPINKALTAEQKIELFRKMVRIRRFEQTALKYYNAGRIGGFLHLYIGQESVAVGTLSLCGENDHNITAYRCHGHAISVGMDMNSLMAGTIFGSTETTFYVLAVYFGSVQIKNARHAVACGLIADLIGVVMAILVGYFFFY